MTSCLLYNDAIIDSCTNKSTTPLILACQKGFDDIFLILINAGADINHRDNEDNSPLHHAVKNNHK